MATTVKVPFKCIFCGKRWFKDVSIEFPDAQWTQRVLRFYAEYQAATPEERSEMYLRSSCGCDDD